jgi:hypothetical protein
MSVLPGVDIAGGFRPGGVRLKAAVGFLVAEKNRGDLRHVLSMEKHKNQARPADEVFLTSSQCTCVPRFNCDSPLRTTRASSGERVSSRDTHSSANCRSREARRITPCCKRFLRSLGFFIASTGTYLHVSGRSSEESLRGRGCPSGNASGPATADIDPPPAGSLRAS